VTRPTKILIVEDEHILAENLRRYLAHHDWDAAVAACGRDAVIASAKFEPDIVLLDYRLPDMDGFQALREMRAQRPGGRCVLMTAHPAETVAAGARQLHIGRVIHKPFSLADMQTELRAALRDGIELPVPRPARSVLGFCPPRPGTDAPEDGTSVPEFSSLSFPS